MTPQRLLELEQKHKFSKDVQELIAEVRRLTTYITELGFDPAIPWQEHMVSGLVTIEPSLSSKAGT
jgi:hypothetical protein